MSDPNAIMIAARDRGSAALNSIPFGGLTRDQVHAAMVTVYCDAYRIAMEDAKRIVNQTAVQLMERARDEGAFRTKVLP